jgi:hypothetical protein
MVYWTNGVSRRPIWRFTWMVRSKGALIRQTPRCKAGETPVEQPWTGGLVPVGRGGVAMKGRRRKPSLSLGIIRWSPLGFYVGDLFWPRGSPLIPG